MLRVALVAPLWPSQVLSSRESPIRHRSLCWTIVTSAGVTIDFRGGYICLCGLDSLSSDVKALGSYRYIARTHRGSHSPHPATAIPRIGSVLS
ncbi:hypothetical protein EDD21DRAFT_363692 [Dissophora ornata]|nr:hypothetical protein EDD21DRAFT_363692 [Dissophora ornata]